ncbi:GNAT family N-acetyltransferase [Streptomyces globisporus]|uniref:GNAT family N-acetyltransferase n=1 Tax=Streptomyces globisporus TaxID=1908 RepID=UPI0036BD4F01
MDPDDLSFVVAEHLSHFPDSFFARLGPKFLTAYNGTYLNGPDARAYIAEMGGRPAGFLIGATDPEAHRRHVLRHYGRGLLFRALGSLLLRPRLALYFLRTRLLRYGRKLIRNRVARQAPAIGHSGVIAVLDYIVVAEHARRRGIGAWLIAQFAEDATDAGRTRVTLVTAVEGGAGPYYDRLGWGCQGEIRTHEGRHLLAYDLPLSEGTTPDRR